MNKPKLNAKKFEIKVISSYSYGRSASLNSSPLPEQKGYNRIASQVIGNPISRGFAPSGDALFTPPHIHSSESRDASPRNPIKYRILRDGSLPA